MWNGYLEYLGCLEYFEYLGCLDIQTIWDVWTFVTSVDIQHKQLIDACAHFAVYKSDLFLMLSQRYPDIERLADILEVTILDDSV